MLQQFLLYIFRMRCLHVFISTALLLAPTASIAKKKSIKKPENSSLKLVAGDLYAQLPLQKRDRSYARGRFVFTEVKVFNKGRRKFRNAELVFETKEPLIHSIVNLENGKNLIRVREQGTQRYVISIRRLSKIKPQIYWVELKLGKATVSQTRKDRRKLLKITLRARNAEGEWETDSTQLSWRLSNCGASYHKALSGGVNTEIDKLNTALIQLARRNNKMPGRWIFSPVQSYKIETTLKDVCTRYKYFRNRRTGKSYRKCTVSKKVNKTIRSPVKPPDIQRDMLHEAGVIIASKGSDITMKRHTDQYWIVRKIYEDIKRYFEQKANPAICTGAIQMTEFYEAKFEPIKEKGEKQQTHVDVALGLAKSHAEKYLRLNPAKRFTSLIQVRSRDILMKSEKNSKAEDNLAILEGILIKIASLARDKEFITEFKNTENILAKLKMFKNSIATYEKDLDLGDEAKKHLRTSLTMIEAAYYLQSLSSRYTRVQEIVYGSIQEIRNMHEIHCNC